MIKVMSTFSGVYLLLFTVCVCACACMCERACVSVCVREREKEKCKQEKLKHGNVTQTKCNNDSTYKIYKA